MTIPELIDRLARATEGSRELDAEIMIALDRVPPYKYGLAHEWTMSYELNHNGSVLRWPIRPDGKRHEIPHGTAVSPKYTKSIDAALTLVPEGAWVKMEHRWVSDAYNTDRECAAYISQASGQDGGARARTFALAICIAALKVKGGEG